MQRLQSHNYKIQFSPEPDSRYSITDSSVLPDLDPLFGVEVHSSEDTQQKRHDSAAPHNSIMALCDPDVELRCGTLDCSEPDHRVLLTEEMPWDALEESVFGRRGEHTPMRSVKDIQVR